VYFDSFVGAGTSESDQSIPAAAAAAVSSSCR